MSQPPLPQSQRVTIHLPNTTSTSTNNNNNDTPMDISASFGNMTLSFCLYNASGPRSGTIEALQKIAASASGAVLTKSATLVPQDGNPLPRTYHAPDQMASFNSEGLPNKGIDYYISTETRVAVMEAMTTTTSTTTKPYIVSISGKCLSDNLEMIRRIVAIHHEATTTSVTPIASMELNLACPNVIGKPIIGYDMDQMELTLRQVEAVLQECTAKYASHASSTTAVILPSLGIKLPPYLDFSHFHAVTQLLNQYSHIVSYVVAINTLGNALCIDGISMGTPHIRSNHGFAGLSGPAIKYTALANVRKLRELLLPKIDIIGVGGICTGQDVYDMILCGATGCQVATQHWKEGSGPCFDRIQKELIHIMQQKGYTNLHQQVYNQLQPYSKERAAMARQEQKLNTGTASSVSASSSSPTVNQNSTDDASFYKSLSIILIIVLAIVLSYELQQHQQPISLLPTE